MSCPTCLDLLRFPVTLGCGHSMCKVCILSADHNEKSNKRKPIVRLLGTKKDIQVTCRICNATSTFSSESALVVDTNLQQMVEVLEGTAVAVTPCMRCEQIEATTSCAECNVKLCSACSDLMHVGRLRNHNISYNAIIDDFKPKLCEQLGHEHYRKDLFCTDCRTFLCVLCSQALPTHRTHNVITIVEASQVERKKLTDNIDAADSFRSELRSTAHQIDDVIEATLRNTKEEISVFEQTMESLISALQQKKETLINNAQRLCETEVEALRSSRDRIFTLAAKLNETVAESNKALLKRSATAIITRSTEMDDQIHNWDPIAISSATCPVFAFPRYNEVVSIVESLELKSMPVTEIEKGIDITRLGRTLAIDLLTGKSGAIMSEPQFISNRNLLSELSSPDVLAAKRAAAGVSGTSITEPNGGILIEPSHIISEKSKKFHFSKSTFSGIEIINGGRTARSIARQPDGLRPSGWETVMCDLLLSKGKHYFEVTLDTYDARDGHNVIIGLIFDGNYGLCDVLGEDNNSLGLDTGRGTKCICGDYSLPYTAPGFIGAGDVIGIDIDFDKETLEYYHNGKYLGVAFTGLNRSCYAAVSLINNQQVTLMFPLQRPL